MHRPAPVLTTAAAAAFLTLALTACGDDSASDVPAPTAGAAPSAAATSATTPSSAADTAASSAPPESPEAPAGAAPTGPTDGAPDDADFRAQHTLTFIALGDDGAAGPPIGCGDSAVPVPFETTTIAPLGEVMRAQLAGHDDPRGASGLYDALAHSELSYDGATIDDGHAVIDLSGRLVMGGECDIPRVREQLTAPALQFSNVDSVQVRINGEDLDDVLSLRN